MLPMGMNSERLIPLLLLSEHFSTEMLSNVSWSSATTKAIRLYPPRVVKMLTTRGQSLKRLRSFSIASELSISINTKAACRSNFLMFKSAEGLMIPFFTSLSYLFFTPMLENPTIFDSSSNVVLPSC